MEEGSRKEKPWRRRSHGGGGRRDLEEEVRNEEVRRRRRPAGHYIRPISAAFYKMRH